MKWPSLFRFKLFVSACCGLLAVVAWSNASTFAACSSEPFWWKVYSILFGYSVASIAFRMGWTVPCTVLGASLGTISITAPCRCGPMNRVEQLVGELSTGIPIGIAVGMMTGIALDLLAESAKQSRQFE